LVRLRKELTAIRRQELARRRELAAAIQGPIEEVVRRDDRIQEIRAREAELVAEQGELTKRLRQVSEEEMQRQWVEVQTKSEEALLEARRAQYETWEEAQREQESMRDRAWENYESLMGRTRSPIIVGQNIMLGAQLAPLNPELAEYFPVDEGVFVIQVLEGTPAFDAGLQGGDIIISVAGEEVISLTDLRFGLEVFEGPLLIQVIRKGEPVEILIRR
jgi:C-terminal processing protease CtpA/Prc